MPKRIIPVLIVLLLPSCNMGMLPVYFENRTLDDIPIEILEPADMAIPAYIQTLLLASPDTPNYNIRAIIQFRDTSDTINHGISNNISEILNQNAANIVYASPRFALYDNQEIHLPTSELDWQKYDSILTNTETDAILTLEVYDAKYRFYTTEKYMFEYNTHLFQSHIVSSVESIWSIRDPVKKERIVIQVEHTDKYEGDYSSMERESFESLPPLEEIIYYDATVVGSQVARKFCPHWLTVERGIYATSHRELRQAKNLIVEDNDWDAARSIWQSNLNDPNVVLAKHSAYNMVVAAEVSDSINLALEKAKQYLLTYDDPNMSEYVEILQDRYEKNNMLDEQFHLEQP